MPHSRLPRNLLRIPLIRRAVKLALDTFSAALAWNLCGFVFPHEHPIPIHLGAAWLLFAAIISHLFSLDRQHFRLFGFRDAIKVLLAGTTLLVLSPCFSLILSQEGALPFGLPILAALLTCFFWMVIRAAWVFGSDEVLGSHPITEVPPKRAFVIGAGRAGAMVAQELNRHAELGSKVVGFLDDALEKQAIEIQGIPVLGPPALLKDLAEEHGIEQVILAIPSAPGIALRRLAEQVKALGLELKTVPGIFDLLGGREWRPALRPLSIEDLLRRDPITLDQTGLGESLREATVLITGAGGSIGSEIARQVLPFRPERLVLLGRGENSLWSIERELRELFPNQPMVLELCDIRDAVRLEQVFQRWRPQVVFHAAAHKHVPYLEMNPEEAVANNVFGTLNVVEAARAIGVRALVNISTDKSVNPTNVLGASKYLAEQLVLRAARELPENHHWVSVRFGNVLGSRGSVIPIFKAQLEKGGPLTVTHPDMTRYFMTIPEASQLVLQAGLLGENAKVYVLDMGEPVKIVDLARDMAELSGMKVGLDIDLQFTGLRPGEKLFEELFNAHEEDHSPVHPKVRESRLESPEAGHLESGLTALREAIALPHGERQRALLQILQEQVPTYTPSPTGLGRYLSPSTR